jgi:hypothetical protein
VNEVTVGCAADPEPIARRCFGHNVAFVKLMLCPDHN